MNWEKMKVVKARNEREDCCVKVGGRELELVEVVEVCEMIRFNLGQQAGTIPQI